MISKSAFSLFQTSNQSRLLLENEMKSLQSEILSLTTAKEWYQQQLTQAQGAKHMLQKVRLIFSFNAPISSMYCKTINFCLPFILQNSRIDKSEKNKWHFQDLHLLF